MGNQAHGHSRNQAHGHTLEDEASGWPQEGVSLASEERVKEGRAESAGKEHNS